MTPVGTIRTSLAGGELTPEEILIRLGQRKTDFRYGVDMGFSYRFGSKLANMVTPG